MENDMTNWGGNPVPERVSADVRGLVRAAGGDEAAAAYDKRISRAEEADALARARERREDQVRREAARYRLGVLSTPVSPVMNPYEAAALGLGTVTGAGAARVAASLPSVAKSAAVLTGGMAGIAYARPHVYDAVSEITGADRGRVQTVGDTALLAAGGLAAAMGAASALGPGTVRLRPGTKAGATGRFKTVDGVGPSDYLDLVDPSYGPGPAKAYDRMVKAVARGKTAKQLADLHLEASDAGMLPRGSSSAQVAAVQAYYSMLDNAAKVVEGARKPGAAWKGPALDAAKTDPLAAWASAYRDIRGQVSAADDALAKAKNFLESVPDSATESVKNAAKAGVDAAKAEVSRLADLKKSLEPEAVASARKLAKQYLDPLIGDAKAPTGFWKSVGRGLAEVPSAYLYLATGLGNSVISRGVAGWITNPVAKSLSFAVEKTLPRVGLGKFTTPLAVTASVVGSGIGSKYIGNRAWDSFGTPTFDRGTETVKPDGGKKFQSRSDIAADAVGAGAKLTPQEKSQSETAYLARSHNLGILNSYLQFAPAASVVVPIAANVKNPHLPAGVRVFGHDLAGSVRNFFSNPYDRIQKEAAAKKAQDAAMERARAEVTAGAGGNPTELQDLLRSHEAALAAQAAAQAAAGPGAPAPAAGRGGAQPPQDDFDY